LLLREVDWTPGIRGMLHRREFQAKQWKEKKVVISFGKSLSLERGVDTSATRV
jgi:hypothetical protein